MGVKLVVFRHSFAKHVTYSDSVEWALNLYREWSDGSADFRELARCQTKRDVIVLLHERAKEDF